jgi:hypothetical protein
MFTSVNADNIEYFPTNEAPIISDENPADGTWDIPLTLSELSFRIRDPEGKLMSYSVTTEPDIGSGSGVLKPNGVYSVPVSSLDYNTMYSWTVEVTDDQVTAIKQFSFYTETVPFNPFNEGWQYRKMITIDNTMVDGYLTSYPVLINTVDVDLRDKAQSDGDGILFMDGTGVANKLYHEIESYDGSSGELVAWVNVPSVSESEDTIFYIYYGNPTCNNQEFHKKVWDSNFVMVLHLNEISGKHYDSTYYGNDGYPQSAVNQDAIGKIDGADEFDGTDGEITVSNDHSLNFEDTNKFSISVWINRNNHPFTRSRSIISKGTSSSKCGYNFGLSKNKIISISIGDGTSSYSCRSNILTNTGIWYHIAGTWDGNTLYFYINGELDNSTYLGDVFTEDDTKALQIGNHYYDHWFAGLIDEVRISKTCRSKAWIKTSFNNMDNPSSFFSVGPEESAP